MQLKFLQALSLLILCLVLSGCAAGKSGTGQPRFQSAGHPSGQPTGQLLFPSQVPMGEAGFAALAADKTYILIGESHDVPHHHLMQAWLIGIAARIKGGGEVKPAIGLEMVPATLQPVLDAFNRGEVSVSALETALDWNNTWGFAFSLYAPIFQMAQGYGLPMYGLNISQAALQEVRAKRGLAGVSARAKKELPTAVLLPGRVQAKELEAFFQAHAGRMPSSRAAQPGSSGMTPKAMLQRFMLVQSLWDTTMAMNARRVHKETGRPVIILAGSGHVAQGQGIAFRLREVEPNAGILLVMPTVSEHIEAKARGDGDVFYYSP